MVYASGVSTIETTSTTGSQSYSGGSYGGGDSWASTHGTISGATTKTSGTATTKTAQRAAPPAKATSGWLAIGCLTTLVGIVVPVAIAAHPGSNELSGLVFFGIVFLGLAWFIKSMRSAFRYNRNVLPQLLETWKRSWMCQSCGNIFQPVTRAPQPTS
jgi:hypothetical protein